MKTFDLVLDRKCTIWEREYYKIDAETKEEALELLLKSSTGGMEDYIEFEYSQTIYDTMENMTVEENNGFSTEEISLRKGVAKKEELLWQNGKGCTES